MSRYVALAYIVVVAGMVAVVGATLYLLMERGQFPPAEVGGVWFTFGLFTVGAVVLAATAWKETR